MYCGRAFGRAYGKMGYDWWSSGAITTAWVTAAGMRRARRRLIAIGQA